MPRFWQVDTRKVCVESLQPHVTNMYAITYVAGVYKREIGRFVDRALIASIVCSTVRALEFRAREESGCSP